jgi:hypothetical protein
MCNTCAELNRLIGHLRVIEQLADAGTRDAATKMIDEKEAERAMLHPMPRKLNLTLDEVHRQR